MALHSYLRFPTISGDDLVFVAEDDLWRVSTSGGRAERLTAAVAAASHPRFSPDGQTLAFTGRDEGHPEVYVMPTSGGAPQRLTYEGSNAAVVAWRPDGRAILYSSPAQQPSARIRVLHSIAPEGGLSTVLPYGPADAIAFGPDGALALGRNGGDPARWKRYRGGTAGQIWIDARGTGTFQRLLGQQAGMVWPCFVGERLYFVSDRDGFGDVYSCLPDGSDLRRHTDQRAEGFYARNLSTDGRRLVYAAGGDLYLLDPRASAAHKLDITLATSRTQLARQFVQANEFLDTAALQPQGRSVALVTRGKAFSMGAWEGPVLQHGAPDGVRYRHITWLADGKHLAAVADTGIEPRLVVFTNDGSEPDRALDAVDIGHVVEMTASPVGQRLFLRNHRGEYLLVEADTGTSRVLDRTAFGRGEMGNRVHGLAWSHDGAWVAYTFGISPQQTAIKLANSTTFESQQVTDPVLFDQMPSFDPKGRYLYFLSGRDFDPVPDNLGFEFSFPRGTRPYLITLRRDLRSPFLPVPEAVKDEFEEKLEQAKKDEQEEKAQPEPVKIDLDGISTRIVPFPVDEGRYGEVWGTHSGVAWSSYPVQGTLHQEEDVYHPSADGGLDHYTFETHKQDHIADGISAFWVSPDGKSLLYRTGDRLRLIKAGEKPPQPEDNEARDKPGRETGWIDLDRVRVSVRPAAEWRQMFDEAWRLQREQFFRADMGGVDWQEVHDRYAPLVERLGSRGDLSDLLWEMQGEIGSSHAYEMGGAYRETPQYTQGHLGVNWRYDAQAGKYRIAHIVHGDPWNPEATSPLLTPGVNVSVGDAVIAINGQRLSAERTPAELLVNQAGQEVELVVEAAAGGAPRAVTVRAVGDPHAGRYRDWVEGMRKHVHLATEGRVGYLHIPDMAYIGYSEFHRYYLQEYDRDALIIDVRWNAGGMVSGLLLEKLMRPRLAYGYQRWGAPDPYFGESPRGPLVAITNENAGSDGDIFSHAFKLLKLGPLIGTRTWGGVIGIDPYIPLADGTIMTQPEFGFFFKDVGWGIENYGTDPTIEVAYPPQAYVAGSDPQLERGIMEALGLLAERDVRTPTPPPWRAPGH